MLKAVIFDLYGTLITSEESSLNKDETLSRVLREAGHEVYFQEVWAARQYIAFIDYPRGRAGTPQEYYSKVLDRLEISRSAALVDELVNKDSELEKFTVYPDVNPCVKELKAKGIKTAIVTTIASWRFLPLLRKNRVEIDFICTAKEAKAVKPNPKIYTTVLDVFGIKPQEAIMVGDDIKTDIVPAKQLRINAALLNRLEKTRSEEADYSISSLAELLTLI